MKKKAMIWRESVYKNGFRCTKCNTPMADMDGTVNEDTVLIEYTGFKTYAYCRKCYLPVAYVKMVEVPEDAHGLMGNLNDYERRKLN